MSSGAGTVYGLGSLALAPRRLFWLPELCRLVQIIDEKTESFRFKFRKPELKGLLRFGITQDDDQMALSEIEMLNREALLARPREHLLAVNFQRKIPGMAEQFWRARGGWRLNGDRCNAD